MCRSGLSITTILLSMATNHVVEEPDGLVRALQVRQRALGLRLDVDGAEQVLVRAAVGAETHGRVGVHLRGRVEGRRRPAVRHVVAAVARDARVEDLAEEAQVII